MSKNSETGHAVNVANFESLISFVKGYGAAYNPTKTSIKIEALEAILVNAKHTLVNIDDLMPAYTNAVSARKDAFASLSQIITRVNNAIRSTDTTELVDESVKTLVRKLKGTRASTKISDEVKAASMVMTPPCIFIGPATVMGTSSQRFPVLPGLPQVKERMVCPFWFQLNQFVCAP